MRTATRKRMLAVRIRGGPTPRTVPAKKPRDRGKDDRSERAALVRECDKLVDAINQIAITVGELIVMSSDVSTANTVATISARRNELEAHLEQMNDRRRIVGLRRRAEVERWERARRTTRPDHLLTPRRPTRHSAYTIRRYDNAAE